MSTMALKNPVLITNDDGYEAEGLVACWRAVKEWGALYPRVAVPHQCWSAKSHATTTRPDEPLRVKSLDHEILEGYIVEGYPADCVRVALRGLYLFKDERPIVVSGINPGANLGMDIFYSGTVAAAREAVALGCHAVAVSVLSRRDYPNDWEAISDWTRAVLCNLEPSFQEKKPVFWNVNIPSLPPGSPMPPVQFVPMSTDPLAVSYFQDKERADRFTYSGSYFERPSARGTDVDALFSGQIAVTPLQLDHTDRHWLKGVQNRAVRSPSD